MQKTQETWVQTLGGGRSPGGGNSNALQYSCLENSMDRGAWQAKVHGVAELDPSEHNACMHVINYYSKHCFLSVVLF